MQDENTNSFESAEQEELFKLLETWPALSHTERIGKFRDLPRTDAEELFLRLNIHDQAEIISETTSHLEKRSWVRLLAPDDVADVIQEMGPETKDEILSLLDPQTRREVIVLLAYAEDNAGGLMSSRYVRLRPEMSVDEAISYLRMQAKTSVETIYYAYVLSPEQTLLGVVSFRELFSAVPGKKIEDIMTRDVIQVSVDVDQEQIARLFQNQDLMALPVVDSQGHMQGIVTFDDVAAVLTEEATEDIQKMGAVETLDAPYLKTSAFEMIKKRGGWLLILFFGETFTATAMSYYQVDIQRAVVLTLFIPLIIASGGNSGSQASTLIIRAMALGEVRIKDWWRVLHRELLAGFSLGLLLGVMGFLKIVLWPTAEAVYGPHYLAVGLTVCFSLIGIVMWGTITGSMLPFLLRKLKFDPASASAPAVATLVDVTGLIIYFTVASLFLSGTLL